MSAKPVIAALGAGRMGRGIAHIFAYEGHEVRLVDVKVRGVDEFAAFRDDAVAEVRGTLVLLAQLGLFDPAAIPRILERVSVHPRERIDMALQGARFIFEGVPEVMQAKRDAFALASAAADEDTVIASSTSTFLVTDLAPMVSRPQRFLNAHWLNPAFLVPLVELSPGPDTDPAHVDRLKDLLEACGKVPVVMKPTPGFIVPRIQALAMNEAARLVEEGVASADDIDKAVKYGFGFRFAVLGLVEFIDWGGGDILYYASRYLAQALHDERFAAPKIVNDMMQRGETGLRAGKGFYDFERMDVEAYRRDRLAGFLALLRHMGLARPPG